MPLRPDKLDACIFCGSRSLSREHVLPEWLQEWSGRGIGEHIVSLGIDSKSFSAPPFTATVKAVCQECNSGWMSRLEAAAKHHLKGLILGHDRQIETFIQPILATWAYKTVLIHEAAMPERKMWLPFYADLHLNRLPHAAAQVYLAKYDWESEDLATRYLGSKARWRDPATGIHVDEGPRLFKGVLTVGSAMFVVCVSHDGAELSQAAPFNLDFKQYATRLERIWPVSFSFTWPPQGLSFSHAEFQDFAVVP